MKTYQHERLIYLIINFSQRFIQLSVTARRLSPAIYLTFCCCHASVTSDLPNFSLLPDVCHQRFTRFFWLLPDDLLKLVRAAKCKLNLRISLCCAGGDLGCPGTCKVARLDGIEEMKMHLTNFVYFSYFYLYFHILFFVFTSDFPAVSTFSYSTNPRYDSQVCRQHILYRCIFTIWRNR